ncbi:MAG: efflux transporter outer membrane subunit [Gammaproteobacteria bacterium]|jgi:NodT family efflux transporter outer membrane factor (OMF) lipoprotein
MSRIAITFKNLVFLLGVAIMSGCANVGPDFKTPAAPAVKAYTHSGSDSLASSARQQLVRGLAVTPQWWQRFGSKKLDALVRQALQNNPSLAAARATLQQAEQLYAAQAGSSLYPTVGAKLSASRSKINAAAFGQQSGSTIFNLYNAGVAVNYDLDIFGGNRRALEALAAKADYQRFQLAAARLTVAGNVVTTAFTQAQLSQQLEATMAILQAQQHQLAIARKRFALGAIARMDLLSLQTQVEQTRATLPALRNKLEQTNHLLATLIGQAPVVASLPQFRLSDFNLPAKLPLEVPSRLVRLRPDIQASTALLHVATAQYDVAVSNLYPQINLSASMGSEALTTSALFGPGSVIWNVAGQLAQPLFNAGLRAGANAAQASLQAAGANYRQTVLQALRNVADVLRQLDNDAEALQAQTAADASSQQALDLVTQQYQLGAASYLQLLTAQQQAQQTRIGLITAKAARLADTAALYQAMGGGVLSLPATGSNDVHTQSVHDAGDAITNTQRSD